MHKFTAGDKVRYTKMRDEAEIISGPYPTHGDSPRWLVRKADDTVSLVRERELSKPMTLVEKVAKALYEDRCGDEWDNASQYIAGTYRHMASVAIRVIEDKPREPLAAGDKIRILETGLDGSYVKRGDVLTVARLCGSYFYVYRTERAYKGATWCFHFDNEGTGWERV